jgi:hypothetical protein
VDHFARACTLIAADGSAGSNAESMLTPKWPQDATDGSPAPKYKLLATCFAYVGEANKPRTWKLPYRTAAGTIDERRLPKAIQALLRNYRGATVGGTPEAALAIFSRRRCGLGSVPLTRSLRAASRSRASARVIVG